MERGESTIRYFSLDEARGEIKKRWNDTELRKKIEKLCGDYLFTDLIDGPKSVLCRSIASPDNGLNFFIDCCHYLNLKPLVIEYSEDKYVVINEEKRGLTKLRITDANGGKEFIDIVDSNKEQGKKMSEVVTNELCQHRKLIDFHHDLFKVHYKNLLLKNYSDWFHQFNNPGEYYFYYLLNFVAHGVYFEVFDMTDSDREKSFVNQNVIQNIKKIKNLTGLDPLVVKLYPDNQTEEEDFYWFSYPPRIQDDIISLIKR